MPKSLQIEEIILDRIVNRSIVLWMALIMQLKRSELSNMDWVEICQSILMMSIWFIGAFRKQLPLFIKSVFIVIISGGIAYLGIFKYGLLAAGFSLIPMTALVIGLFFHRRAFCVFFVFNVLVLVSFALLFSKGYLSPPLSEQAIGIDIGQWGMFIVSSAVVVFFIGISLLEYKKELSSVVQSLSDQHQKMEQLASYDQLTGLSLMTFAEKKIEKLIEKRAKHNSVAVLFMDVDNFKIINDHYGHEAGDCCLQFIANTIKSIIREGDEACRIGGDEMVVICDQMKSHDAALELSNRLAQQVAAGFLYEEHHIPVSVSIGVSMAPFHSNKFQELRRCADYAMYQAKKMQEHHVVMYSP